MTNDDKLNKAVNAKIDQHTILQKEYTHSQIVSEYIENEKAKYCMKWLLSVADGRKNKKLYDSITLLNKRLEKHSKLISDLKHYESKASYYEIMYNSCKLAEEENKVMREKLIQTL